MRSIHAFSTRLLLVIIAALILILAAVGIGSVVIHERSMRQLVGERDLRAVRTAAAALADANRNPEDPHVRDVLTQLQMNAQTGVILTDHEGRIVAGSDASQIGQFSTHSGVTEALVGRSGILYRSDRPGREEHVVAYAPVDPPGWALVIEEPWRQVINPLLRTSLFAPLVLIPAVATALLLIWLGVKRIVHPLQQLDVRVAQIGQGNFAAIAEPIHGIREVEELQQALARMAGQIKNYQQSLREYVGALTTAQEDERGRLARELHDETVQSLIALKQRVQVARRKASGDQAGNDARLGQLQDMIQATIDEVRRFSQALRPIYLEEAGLVPALRALARNIGQAGMPVAFEVEGEPRRLPPEIELALYRITQEALNNVVKHARATRAAVQVRFSGNELAIQVQDNGAGFVVPEHLSTLAGAGHYGLMGIQERAELAGARVRIDSHPGQGTIITVQRLVDRTNA